MRGSKVYEQIFEADESQLNNRIAEIADYEKQLSISNATWALEVYERAVGLKVDNTRPIEERRSLIKSKLRGFGKSDADLIKNIVKSWTNGTTDVFFENGLIKIKFIDTIGIPRNMTDVHASVEEIKPAHLDFVFEYLYNLYADLEPFTYDQLSNYTYDQLRNEVIV